MDVKFLSVYFYVNYQRVLELLMLTPGLFILLFFIILS